MSTWLYFADFYDADNEKVRPQDLDYQWYSMMQPFIIPYLPPAAIRPGAKAPSEPLGLILTRSTSGILAGASPPAGDLHWKAALGSQTVYIDVPHGAVLIGDTLQLRAVFARRLCGGAVDQVLIIGLVTLRGSEQSLGRMAAILQENGQVGPALDDTGAPMTELELLPPFTDPEVEPLARARTADFLRLTLAYHFFGPQEVHQPVAATLPGRLLQGKPRKDESLFAMVRLQPARDRLGRPAAISANWSLTAKQEVSGHFKLQPYGPGGSLRKLIWVDAYGRGPDNAPIKPQAYKI